MSYPVSSQMEGFCFKVSYRPQLGSRDLQKYLVAKYVHVVFVLLRELTDCAVVYAAEFVVNGGGSLFRKAGGLPP